MNRAKRAYFALIVVNILLIGAIAGTYYFTNKVAKEKSSKIASLKADIESNDQAILNFKNLEQTVEKNKDFEKVVEQVLPKDKEQAVALAELDKFSRESGVPIKQISYSNGTATGKNTGPTLTSPSNLKGVLVTTVSIRSDKAKYEQVLDFLNRLEQNRRHMQVTSITLTPSSQVIGLIDSVDITLDIYLKP